ncbi:hypothetical protein BV25DRAFT_1805009 [Artomyces pyxidatus]|uniref:Uncharacterized protein n=1 Tax=Artomyces pyxidatus TaxID=48021 RepID=A0ACB8T003_9AGAM|nr:hypothetical protein BV25DRAFT_1805009 [Artomyces pyxidatus]
MPNTYPLTQKVISNPVIVDLICAHSSPANMLRLSRTCRDALASVRSYFRRAFNINNHLARWFPDPLAFRALQARTTTLISGSNALQFFERTDYPDSDLDLFTPKKHVWDVVEWLVGVGYVFVPRKGQDATLSKARVQKEDIAQTRTDEDSALVEEFAYGACSVIEVYTFHKQCTVDGSVLQVQIVGTRNPPIAAVLKFHSTCVMNVIGYSTAYALYPRATFESRRALVTPTDGLNQGPPLQKYAGRGWSMVRAADPALHAEPSFAPCSRWIDDEKSWVMPLTIDGLSAHMEGALLEPDPVEITNWRQCVGDCEDYDSMCGENGHEHGERAWMTVERFADICLKHEYAFSRKMFDGKDDFHVRALEELFVLIQRDVLGGIPLKPGPGFARYKQPTEVECVPRGVPSTTRAVDKCFAGNGGRSYSFAPSVKRIGRQGVGTRFYTSGT